MANATHYHYGAGLHGYLYQDGPHYADTFGEAAEALAESYSLGRDRKRRLRRDGYIELALRRDGNEYCEIAECADPACKPEDFD